MCIVLQSRLPIALYRRNDLLERLGILVVKVMNFISVALGKLVEKGLEKMTKSPKNSISSKVENNNEISFQTQ